MDFTSCSAGMFALGLWGGWKSRVKSSVQLRTCSQAQRKDEKLGFAVMKRSLECFNYLGFCFFFVLFIFHFRIWSWFMSRKSNTSTIPEDVKDVESFWVQLNCKANQTCGFHVDDTDIFKHFLLFSGEKGLLYTFSMSIIIFLPRVCLCNSGCDVEVCAGSTQSTRGEQDLPPAQSPVFHPKSGWLCSLTPCRILFQLHPIHAPNTAMLKICHNVFLSTNT